MNNAFLKSFLTLQQVYGERAFSSLALNKTLSACKSQDRALITKIVYGVLDEDLKLNYVISRYVKKMPKGDVLIILKMGTYCLWELSLPVYTVVNDLAELAKVTEDRRQVGFVNATLKSISADAHSFDRWPTDEVERCSVTNSYPEWALRKLIKDYGKEEAFAIASYKPQNTTSVRLADPSALSLFDNYESTCFEDAILVSGKLPQQDGRFTAQSLSSMAISHAVANVAKSKVLDCCSAPGGKAVYIKQLRPDLSVVACDIHRHRVELINSYAKRMNVDLETHCLDMTMPKTEWNDAFDVVLCDVPCSGFGVLDNRPDIKLFRENADISELMKLQQKILSNCADFVAVGGHLVFSTCTVFHNENGQNVRKFLKEHANFEQGEISIPQLPQTANKSSYQFLPHKDGMQGFYLAVLKRIY